MLLKIKLQKTIIKTQNKKKKMNCQQFERDMELTCSGTESCDVRIMASAIPWAYQG